MSSIVTRLNTGSDAHVPLTRATEDWADAELEAEFARLNPEIQRRVALRVLEIDALKREVDAQMQAKLDAQSLLANIVEALAFERTDFDLSDTWRTAAPRILERLTEIVELAESWEMAAREYETALAVAGRHLEDCCRTDIDLGEQMDTHHDAVNAVHRAERITSSDGRGNQEHLSSAQAASPACPEFDARVDYPERYREGPI